MFAISSFVVAFVPRFVFKWVKLGDFDFPDIFRIMSQTFLIGVLLFKFKTLQIKYKRLTIVADANFGDN